MKVCEYIQAQLLEYVYGLPGDDERQSIEEHLAGCGACRAALDSAREQQQRLGAASKLSFAGVRFEAPKVSAPAASADEGRPATLPMSIGGGSPSWFRWSVAAGLLLLIGGLGVHAGLGAHRRDQVQQAEARRIEIDKRLAMSGSQINQVDEQLRDIERAIDDLKNQGAQDIHKAWQDAQNKPFQVTVTGPRSPEPGAENVYNIQIRKREAQPTPVSGRVTVRLVDQQNQKPLFEMIDVQTKGDLKVTLPKDLPLNNSDLKQQLALEVRAEAEGHKTTLEEILPIGGPVYLTHLATDKPMYQPGEMVRFRSLTLERSSLKPVADEMHLQFMLKKPSGEQVQLGDGLSKLVNDRNEEIRQVLGPDNRPIRGIGAGEWSIPADAPGGEYTLEVREAKGAFLPLERKFIVNKYQVPRLNKELEFSKKTYGQGESVSAACKVARAEGGKAVANAPVTATVLIDGVEYGKDGKPGASFALKTDAQGAVLVKFQLPAKIERGAATLSVTFHDGDVDTIVRPIPIVLDKMQVEFYPEGGDLIAGVPNRIYFQVRNTLGKPADLKGRIVDEKNQVLADVATFSDPKNPGANHGVGVFKMSPVENAKYELVIDEPVGIKSKHPLPAVKADGLVLALPQGVVPATEALVAEVRSGKADRNVLVGVYCRGQLMAHERVHVRKGETARVTLKPESKAGGVYRVTVFEEIAQKIGRPLLVPRAERLTYREPTENLKLNIKPEKDQYFPGDKVKLVCSAVDEKGQSAPAIVMLAVVDKSVLKLADEKTYRSMPTHFLLTTEVQKPEDLEHADFLLTNHASAKVALDMLLGTQGWRRFAEQKLPEQFRIDKPEAPQGDVDRLLVLSGRLEPATLKAASKDADVLAIRQVADKFKNKIQTRQDDYLALEVKREQLATEDVRLKTELIEERKQAEADYRSALASLSSFETYAVKARKVALPALMLALLVVAGVGLLRGAAQLKQRAAHAMPYMAMAACSVLLVAVFAALQFQAENPGAMEQVAQTLRSDLEMPQEVAQGNRVDRMLEENVRKGDDAEADGKKAGFKRPVAEDPGKNFDKNVPVPMAAPPGQPAQKPQPGVAALIDARNNAIDMIERQKQQLQQGKGEGGKAKEAKEAGLAFARGPQRDQAEKAAKDLDAWRSANGKERAEMERMNRGRVYQERRQAAADEQLKKLEKLANQAPGKFNFIGGAGQAAGRPGDAPLLREALDRAREVAAEPMAPVVAPFMLREYAHVAKTSENGVRVDFTETLFWHPVLVLPDGKAEAVFDLNDSVTTFQVLAAGHTVDGRIGEVTYNLESRLPLVLDPKIPLEVTATDTLAIPVSIANNTDQKATVDVVVAPSRLTLLGGTGSEQVNVDAQKRERRIYRFKPSIIEGEVALRIDGQGKNIRGDKVERAFKVVPDGFPVIGAKSDLLEGTAQHDLVLPESWIKGTLKYEVAVYPSTLADLQKGLEAMLREPHGCFEQTSTTNYPNLLILDYLKETDQANPETARRAQELIDKGYKRLTSFECKKKAGGQEGYEWFGGFAPPHEALTAYGLMQFRDMAAVYNVDQTMVERTRDYLMSRRDGKGGFQRNARALDTFGRAPDNITNAYIVWALSESSKTDDIAKEVEALVNEAKTSKDPYFLALVANTLLNRGRTAEGIDMLKKVGELQKPDGHLAAEKTSITGSGGQSLMVETTSLALLAWLKAHRPDLFNGNIQKAVKWIGTQRGGRGGFGATQSTILALKALIAYAKENKKTATGGDLVLMLDGKEIGRKKFEAGSTEAIVVEVADAENVLKPGKNALKLEISGNNVMPFTSTWSYRAVTPLTDAKAAVKMSTTLNRTKVNEGDTVDLKLHVENASDKGQGMAVAIVGLPAGLTIPEDLKQLKQYCLPKTEGERPDISYFEIKGRELVLYWRDLKPNQKIDLNLSLIARVPGEYRGPASRSYLYYTPEHKDWVAPLSVEISPK